MCDATGLARFLDWYTLTPQALHARRLHALLGMGRVVQNRSGELE